MRHLSLLLVLVCLSAPLGFGQGAQPGGAGSDEAVNRLLLLSDLQDLDDKSGNLATTLARAKAKAEIADAAWALDQPWSEGLLRAAYELTLPDEEEQARLRGRALGEAISQAGGTEIARNRLRQRVLEIAGRSRPFVESLVKLGAEKLGRQEQSSTYSSLARKAVAAGDMDSAGAYISKSLESDPTIINAGLHILDVAVKDRAAADELTLRYMDTLRAARLSASNDGAYRAYYLLQNLVFPSAEFLAGKRLLLKDGDPAPAPIPPAGPPVIKAYISYVIDSLGELEQREPGSATKFRGVLMSTWLPLKQYAPELTGAFLRLEELSRTPGQAAPLPQEGADDRGKTRYDDLINTALSGARPDEIVIETALTRGDFDSARKLIGKLPDGERKTQLFEKANAREAISLASGDDISGAMKLASQLNRADLILQVYPTILNKCAAKKDRTCVTSMTHQAIQRLSRADTSPSLPTQGLALSARNFSGSDPVLSALGKLSGLVAPLDEGLSMEVLDEMIAAANRSRAITDEGNVGFEADVFKQLAPRSGVRVLQAAEGLKDPLRRIVALAAVYQSRVAELTKKSNARTAPPPAPPVQERPEHPHS